MAKKIKAVVKVQINAGKATAAPQKGSGQPNKNKVGKLTRAKVRSIAEIKMNDLNANSIDSAMRMVEGTARSMGVEISG